MIAKRRNMDDMRRLVPYQGSWVYKGGVCNEDWESKMKLRLHW